MAWLTQGGAMMVSSGLVIYGILTAFLAVIIMWFFKRQQKVWMIDQIPGPKALPLIGNALEVNCEPRELFLKLLSFSEYATQGRQLARIWLGTNPYVIVFKAQGVEVILNSSKHINKSRDYDFIHPWLGTGLLTATGSKWHGRRKMLTPAFHFKILEDFVDVFNVQSEKLCTKLQAKADGQVVDVFRDVTLCALDIIAETAMGVQINAQDNSDSAYVKAVYRTVAIIQKRQARPWLQPKLLFYLLGEGWEHNACLKTMHDFSYSTIRARRKEYQQRKKNPSVTSQDDDIGKKKRLAFLDLLLEYSEEGSASLDDEDIREEVDTFMFEGHDTTAAAINWTLYLLGAHPKIQARVHEELDSVFTGSDRPFTMADLSQLKTLDNCVKESLRLFPSVPFLGRELTEDCVIDKYKVPAGTTALIMIYRLHRDPEQFPDPEVFNPDRFLPENCKGRHPYAYVPFSAGPRNCIGQKFAMMEEKIVLGSVLRKFRVESVRKREDLRILGELILRPEDGNHLKLFPRT